MRLVPLILLVACAEAKNDWQDTAGISAGRLAPTSTIGMPFNGIYLAADQDSGMAGFGEAMCNYLLEDGDVGVDTDPTDDQEFVQDGRQVVTSAFGDTSITLGRGGDTLYELGLPSAEVSQQWTVPGVLQARYVPDGVAALRIGLDGECHLDVIDGVGVVIPEHFCDESASMARTPGGVILADADGAIRVEAGVVTELPFTGWLVATHGEAVTVASASTVSRSGGWTTDVGGPVRGLAHLGDDVLAAVGGEQARLVILGEDGAITSDQALTDRMAGALYAAEDGKRVVMSSPMWSDAFIVR